MTIAIRQLIRDWALNDSRRIAIHTTTGHITYSSLHDRILRLASTLRSSQIRPGSQVALAFANSTDFIIWLFAIFELDAIACPVDPQLSTSETQRLLEVGEIDFFCGTQVEKIEDWISLSNPTEIQGQLWCRQNDLTSRYLITDKEVVLRQFTSGSTGDSRHILRNEQQLAEDYRHFCDHLGLEGTERFLGVAPFYHAFGALGLFACLSIGASILPIRRFIPGELLSMASQFQPTVFLATPPMIELLGRCLLRHDENRAFDRLKYCICATGKLKQEASDSFTNRFRLPVSVLYGSSEILSATIDLEGNFVEDRVGKPFPGVILKIFDDSGGERGVGEIGRIGVSSPASCIDYAVSEEPLATVGRFTLPGDKGYLDQAGQLYVLGRDDCINIGGYKVDRVEVQDAIQRITLVNYVAVLPYLRAGQPALRAVVEADPEKVTVDMITAVCRQYLAAYKIPARIDIYAKISRDINGKVQLSRLGALGTSADFSQ